MPFTLNNNEFLANLTNLCLQVLTFENLNFKQPFGVFERAYTKWGDKIACVNAWVEDGEDYNKSTMNDPFDADEPRTYETTITTVLKKRYSLKLSEDLLRGAFEDENSLSMFLTTLINQLRVKAQIDIYEKIISDFANVTSLGTAQSAIILPTELTESNGDAVRQAYIKMQQVAHEMRLPNNKYGRTLNTTTNAPETTCAGNTRIILFVTPAMKSLLDTYVNASLFNSSTISYDKYFDEVRVVDVETNDAYTPTACYGFIATEDVYRFSPRIETIRSQPNGGNLTLNYFYHVWTNAGFTGAGQLSFIGVA